MTTENTDDQSVFKKEDTVPATVAPETPTNEYVGEGKKYATADIALASIAPSQQHIADLEEKLLASKANFEALQEDLKKRETAEEIISRINPVQPDVATPAQTVDLESIRQAATEAALNALTSKEHDNAKLANEQLVSDSLKNMYGDSVATVINEKLAEVGLDLAGMKAMSQSSPKAVLAMFGKSTSIDMVPKSSNGSAIAAQLIPKTDRPRIMGASSTNELVSEWRRCKALVQ